MNMHSGNLQADPAVVRAFLEIINAQAARALNGAHEPGLLQLVRIPAAGGTAVTSRFPIGAVDRMVEAALGMPLLATMSTSRPALSRKAPRSAARSKTRAP